MNKFIYVIAIFMLCACGVEEEIDKAAKKCEEQVAKALENVENICLTKEDVLELMRSARNNTDEDTEEKPRKD